MPRFDVVVVGAGHAGAEAAAIAARLGRSVACVTFRRAHVGRLSCNPAVGGQAKGHLVREIDALGGVMARVADAACIQFRRLNTRKGLAVQASRAQVDIDRYPAEMARALAALPTLQLVEGEVSALHLVGDRVGGVILADGTLLEAPSVILTTGTFLGGTLHRGSSVEEGGRVGDAAAHGLSRSLRTLGLSLGRLKTGTVPRLDARTIDWSRTEPQLDTVPGGRFSYGPPGPRLPQVTCHSTYTNGPVHDLIRANLHRSPMFTGQIVGRGPRYCPSIEDKVVRFAERDRHLLFLEPEGLDTHRVYVNGLSTSLPAEVQDEVLRSIPGLEHATVLQHGYAVEYDHIDPTTLDHGLRHRELRGLSFAGQVNGTSGYEEAAAQGLIAGLSAALGEVFHVERSDAYLGVLVDDLVVQGIGGEPYRMFTSRAEHRLLLREDNADVRLMPRARALGLIEDATWSRFEARQASIEDARRTLSATTFSSAEESTRRLAAAGLAPARGLVTGLDLLRRPEVDWAVLQKLVTLPALDEDSVTQLEADVKYAGYVERARRQAEEARKMEAVALPSTMDWHLLTALSTEVRERLSRARPETLGQASRVPGVTPAAVGTLAAWLVRTRTAAT
jgi:tRNA uridine 5-carboxymethylaminomethyl modification enzyme